MADFFSRLAERTLSVAPVAEPTVGSLFSSTNLFSEGSAGLAQAPEQGFIDEPAGALDEPIERDDPPAADPRPRQPATSRPADAAIGDRRGAAPDIQPDMPAHRPAAPSVSAGDPDASASSIARGNIDAANDRDRASDANDGGYATLLPERPLAGIDVAGVEAPFTAGPPAGEVEEHENDERTTTTNESNHDDDVTTRHSALGAAEDATHRRPATPEAPGSDVERTLLPRKPTTARTPWWSSPNDAAPPDSGEPRGSAHADPDASGGIASRRDQPDDDPRRDVAHDVARDAGRGDAPSLLPATPAGDRAGIGSSHDDAPRGRSEERSSAADEGSVGNGRSARGGDASRAIRVEPSSERMMRYEGEEPGGRGATSDRGESSGTRSARGSQPARGARIHQVEARADRGTTESDGGSPARRSSEAARQLVPTPPGQLTPIRSTERAEGERSRRDHHAQAQPQPQAPSPIKVSIGRIEVKAVMQTPPAQQTRQAPQQGSSPILTLDNYLQQRNGRSR